MQDAGVTPPELKEVLLVGGSTRIPAVRQMVKNIFHREPSRTINPDEAVAMGAAIQSAIIDGSLTEVILLDITPHSLGIETEKDHFSVLVPRNSNIPTSASKRFTTTVDNQKVVRIHVLQGETAFASQNHSLCFFKLSGIPPAPKEIPEIEVKFQIDANGILHVSAIDISSGTSREVDVEAYQEVLSQPMDKKATEEREPEIEDEGFEDIDYHAQDKEPTAEPSETGSTSEQGPSGDDFEEVEMLDDEGTAMIENSNEGDELLIPETAEEDVIVLETEEDKPKEE
jgi:molecular chaperone DnaK